MLYSEAPARTSQKRVNHTAPQFADMGLNQKQKIIAAAIAALHTQQTELELEGCPRDGSYFQILACHQHQ